MSIEIPPQLYENLSENEDVKKILKTSSLLNIPEFTFLSDRRILYYNQKVLGRYDFVDIPYSRLASMKAERGRMVFGSIIFESEDGSRIRLKRVPKNDIEDFVLSLEIAINNIAVEPIRIKRSKGLMGKMTWEFKKTPEMIFKTRTPETSVLKFESEDTKLKEDPLSELKMRLAKGEITADQYIELKNILEG